MFPAGASSTIAYWLSDIAPSQLVNFLGCTLFAAPVYTLTKLRPGAVYFGNFIALLVCSVYCNMGLAFLLSTVSKTAFNSRLIFNGVLLPLQLLCSGVLVLLSTMSYWYKWGALLDPMSYFMAGCLANEFDGNSAGT